MYDSRSDHPHKGVHGPRSWREMGKGDYIDWGTPRSRHLVLARAERDAIAEGLADLEPEEGESHETWMQECIEDLDATYRTSIEVRPEPLTDQVALAYSSEHYNPLSKQYKFAPKRGRGHKEAEVYDLNTIPADPQDIGRIRKPRIAKHKPRLTAEEFDPSKVSRTLSPRMAADITADQPAKTTVLANH